MGQCHASLLPSRAVLRIGGADARKFLQGLVTNDIDKAQGGAAGYETGGAGFSSWYGAKLGSLQPLTGVRGYWDFESDQHLCPKNLDDLFFKGLLGHDFVLVY